MAITADNQLIGAGNGEGGAPFITRRIFYFKFDLNGNALWIRSSNDTRPIYTRALLPTSQSEYFLVNDIFDNNSSTKADPINQGVAAGDGAITWTSPRYDYIPGMPYVDDVYAGALGHGGNVYTTGRSYVALGPGTMRPFISKFNANGVHLWSKYYVASSVNEARVYGIDIIHADDELTVCYFGDINQYSSNYRVGLIHTDTLGNFIWGKDYQINNFSSELSYKVVRMPYGYAITGYGIGGTNDLFAVCLLYTSPSPRDS